MFVEKNNTAANTEATTPEGTATPQTAEGQTETTTLQQATETEVQGSTIPDHADVTTTQAFSKRLKEATEKARNEALDEFVVNQGYEYKDKPINTYAEYQQAIAEAEAEKERARLKEETGIDPNAVQPLFEKFYEQKKQTDPDFQELSKARQKQFYDTTLTEFNSEMKDLGLDIELKSLDAEELSKLPNVQSIVQYMEKNYSLKDAYFLANKKDILGKKAQAAQQETINKITANGQSSPGSLGGGGESEAFFTKEQVEKMTKEEVRKNYNQILKSTSKW